MSSLVERIQKSGLDAGLDRIGVAAADPFAQVAADLKARKAAGLASKLAFTYAHPEAATDVRTSFPWAERLVVGMRAYLPEAGSPGPSQPGTGRVARFAVADAYVPLRRGLEAVASVLETAGHRTVLLADDNRLVDRAAAVRAGIGWWAKNSMVLAPGVGPWALIGTVVTDAALPVNDPMLRDCGTCEACLPACPTGALVAPGVLDARRCLAAWAQAPGIIPLEYRSAMGDRLYGCDDCLDACPPGHRLLETASEQVGRVDLVALLSLTDDELMGRFAHWYVPRRSANYIRRNALIALGNSNDRRFVEVIAPFVGDASSILRVHAAWALGRLGGTEAARLLASQRAAERVDEVVAEIEAALIEAG
ncbi:MAG: tRNA epoxyqueuosine(34) reductase QueG [Acidimicrobiia bacterium]|nr:tRNA epoxyqueuosine(34) reductase QueG [Acidimicrobiia bacterium]